MVTTTRCFMVAYVGLLCILGGHHLVNAVSLGPKIRVNPALLVTMCTGATLSDYPPTASGRAAATKICEPPATLHSKCSNDAISTFVNARSHLHPNAPLPQVSRRLVAGQRGSQRVEEDPSSDGFRFV